MYHELSICRYGSNANLPSVISASVVISNGWDGPWEIIKYFFACKHIYLHNCNDGIGVQQGY